MMNQIRVLCCFFILVLSGCGISTLEQISPLPYSSASQFANKTLMQSNCMGRVDNLFFKPAIVNTDSHGVKTFTGNHSDTHCNAEDFMSALERYCQSKGGAYKGSWCVKNDEPLFHIEGFTIQEKSESLTDKQWQQVARARLGYVSSKDYQEEKARDDAHAMSLKQQREARLKSKVNASVGDFICREDSASNGKYFQGPVYYGAYVEGKKKGKLKLRVVWHGRKDLDIVNSHLNEDETVWEKPEGWFLCDRQVINTLP
ncbi:hypothetical protein [Pantoea ananatis]|uniref:hypothetical protein n=1 Tax=Pantoea ananas TaxID=553 RepID=UPI001B3107F1|nr:hypothetical protein [Pantoea ananatis]